MITLDKPDNKLLLAVALALAFVAPARAAQPGQVKWSFATGGPVWSCPAIGADGTIYAGSENGTVYAVHGSAGLANSPWPKFRHDARNTGFTANTPPVIRQPSRVVLKEGVTAQIAVQVTGMPTISLQWSFNDQPISGGTQATLSIPSVTRAAEGIYTVVASNSLGQVTSKPILALVSNVDPQSFVGLRWGGEIEGPYSLEATAKLGALAAWRSLSNYPASGAAPFYAEVGPVEGARFCRVNGAWVRLTAGRLNGWWMQEPAGSRIHVEVVSAATGWTNWQTLTNLALPASPYLFLDEASLGAPERVYRTTVLP